MAVPLLSILVIINSTSLKDLCEIVTGICSFLQESTVSICNSMVSCGIWDY